MLVNRGISTYCEGLRTIIIVRNRNTSRLLMLNVMNSQFKKIKPGLRAIDTDLNKLVKPFMFS
jgi:hypothetical protein